MRKKYNVLFPLLLSLSLIIGMFLGGRFTSHSSTTQKSMKADEKFSQVINFINRSYVDEPDDQELVEHAITGMLKELDPHSTYISLSEIEAMNQPLQGNFEGVGIEFNILKDTIMVVSPIAGGPSEALGIRAGDKIIKVDGENMAGKGITNMDVVNTLRGEKGTVVTVGIQRKGEDELLEFDIKRDKIPIYSVDAKYMIDDKIGYIKINRFSAKTMQEFHKAIMELSDQGMESLILDLKGNPGGYLNAAVQLADEFLEPGKKIVYTEGRAKPKQTFNSTPRGYFQKGKLVVLIDEGSASASEIVSGAVQDWDRGMVIGRRSFGKGLVQEPYELKDGSAIRLTVARYYTPTGRSIQKPYEGGVEDYYGESYERMTSGELFSMDSVEFADSLKFETPNGRTVYGGGGIMPDIFIPLDTAHRSDYFTQLVRKGLINQFALEYLDKNRKDIQSTFEDLETFKNEFNKDGKITKAFVDFADKNGVEKDPKGLEKSKHVIEVRMKALIGRQIWKSDGFYELINELDDSYQKAIMVIQDDTFDKMDFKYK